MTEHYTKEELEDAEYEIWLLSGGPAAKATKDRAAAEETFTELEAAGWRIVEDEMFKPMFEDAKTTRLVIVRGSEACVVVWNYGAWFMPSKSGGSSRWTDYSKA